jgi:DNA-directed RNA polymerase subunit N (RpoN/RPB10)
MPEPVRCDVCGKMFSSRHVSSHKRLAHAKVKAGSPSEQERMQTMLDIFKSLSEETKKRVLAQLAAGKQDPS